jgi:hypothetical protein
MGLLSSIGLGSLNPVGLLANVAAGGAQAYLGYRAAEKQRQAELDMFNTNVGLQREFAQNGVQWKVADAQKAGISPLAALGAQTHQFSPVQVGNSAGAADSVLGDALGSMGQNISRAVMASATKEQRAQMQLQTQNMRLKNQLLKKKIGDTPMDSQYNSHVRTSNPGNPAMPNVEHRASMITGQSSKKNIQAGAIPDVGYAFTGTGLAPIPSSDVKERIEDQIIPETMWAIRNYGGALTSDRGKPSVSEWKQHFPKASDVEFDIQTAEWVPVYGRKGSTPWNKFKNTVKDYYYGGEQRRLKQRWDKMSRKIIYRRK